MAKARLTAGGKSHNNDNNKDVDRARARTVCKPLQARTNNEGNNLKKKNPHKRRFLVEIKRNELFAGLYFYACADYGHMAGARQNCDPIYSRQKSNMQTNQQKKQNKTEVYLQN